jgi:ATP-binding protein involved in chromosome partitioning
VSTILEKKYIPDIKRVIGVVSGKGGVGKSIVAVLLAQSLAANGHKVGVLDADITGPSLPRLLGLESFRAESDGERLFPLENAEGIKLLSINLFNDDEDAPVIWRGPLLAGALSQFWAQTDWGELDYLVVDFPPGTSDVVLTAFQTIPFAGVFIVATPQDYVSMIVRKSVRMAQMLDTPVLGVVENMRSLICPNCGEEIVLFDDGNGRSADRLGLPLVASLPWRREVAQARALVWTELPEEVRLDAAKISFVAEKSVAPEPKERACDPGEEGCECGKQSCCSSCGSNPEGAE